MTDSNEKRIKRLINKYQLRSINLSVSTGVAARALPASYSPVVDARRQKAFAAHTGSISIQEAEAITNLAMNAIANGHGSDIASALTSLENELEKVCHREQ